MRTYAHLLICFLLLLVQSNTNAQEITVRLGKPTTLDYLSRGIETFRDEPGISQVTKHLFDQEELIFPVDTAGSFFFSVYAGGNEKETDHHVAVMVTPAKEGEYLYIDLNNDNNLRNDGGPFFFPKSKNKFSFFMQASSDSKQKSARLLLRYPSYAFKDSNRLEIFKEENLDEEGNLNQYWTNYWRRHNPSFSGKKGTFYYSERLNLRRGKITIEDITYSIGLYDWTANGLYNDEQDKLLVDLNRDSRLSQTDSREVFNINDTFWIRNQGFKLSKADPYGNELTLKKIKEKNDLSYILFSDSISLETRSEDHFPAKLNEEFWTKEFVALSRGQISMSSLKGQFILLNFWGEWCKPCYKEIPLLVEANQTYPSGKLKIISFLKTYNLPKAQKVILYNKMNWDHIRSNNRIEKKFKVSAFPRNMLIYPDGQTALISGGIEEGFFDYYIK